MKTIKSISILVLVCLFITGTAWSEKKDKKVSAGGTQTMTGKVVVEKKLVNGRNLDAYYIENKKNGKLELPKSTFKKMKRFKNKNVEISFSGDLKAKKIDKLISAKMVKDKKKKK